MKKVLHILEFDKIIEQLRSHTASSMGTEKAEALAPSTSIEDIHRLQEETEEGVTVLRLKGSVPLGGIHDLRSDLKRAQAGGMLNVSELLDVADTLNSTRRLQTFFHRMVEDDVALPYIYKYVNPLVSEKELENTIRGCISEQGAVLDSASAKLRDIRWKMQKGEARIREKLEHMIHSSETKPMLTDTVITIRSDRYVLPVKKEYRNRFGGIVHDQSSSGVTVFIEPASIVEVNNQLREGKLAEEKEIERILADLSRLIAEKADVLLYNTILLKEIDFIFAKAHYAQVLSATKPNINTSGRLAFKEARHPFIPADQVVPIDVTMGDSYDSLIITGPNTGGKTVTLKTIGLMVLMAQSGLQIPAQDGAQIPLFHTVFADIGDEQSIAQSLSTFSSHMTNIIDIMEHVDSHSLVLLDELGAGTDPQEGAALAIAILSHLQRLGASVVATTHYSELKAYAYEHERVLNASVEFDIETLEPTYRLILGVPGRSNAFDISRRLGMNMAIIQKAKQYISRNSSQVDHFITSLEKNQKQAEADRNEAEKLRREVERLKEEWQQKTSILEKERSQILQKAGRQAKEAVASAKQQAESLIQELREARDRREKPKDHELIEMRKKLDEVIPSFSEKAPKSPAHSGRQMFFHSGEEVRVKSLGRTGQIIEKLADDEYRVQLGIIKMNVQAHDLRPVCRKEQEPVRSFISVEGNEHVVGTELDVHGERYEEAMRHVEKYLDSALLSGLHQVSIIHGKGTGALRSGVQKLLKGHPHVKSTRMGEAGEGGSGVTIVVLR